jgi:hypothetical protein
VKTLFLCLVDHRRRGLDLANLLTDEVRPLNTKGLE